MIGAIVPAAFVADVALVASGIGGYATTIGQVVLGLLVIAGYLVQHRGQLQIHSLVNSQNKALEDKIKQLGDRVGELLTERAELQDNRIIALEHQLQGLRVDEPPATDQTTSKD